MNAKCATGRHDWKKVYPDQELIDAIKFVQPIEEIWECTRCEKAQKRTGTVGTIESDWMEEKRWWHPKNVLSVKEPDGYGVTQHQDYDDDVTTAKEPEKKKMNKMEKKIADMRKLNAAKIGNEIENLAEDAEPDNEAFDELLEYINELIREYRI